MSHDVGDHDLPGVIAALRKKSGLTQAQVAKAVGKTEQMGGKWERGENIPAPETRLALAGLFGVSADALGYHVPDDHTPEAPEWAVKLQATADAILDRLERMEHSR